jgi:hypothetical protein
VTHAENLVGQQRFEVVGIDGGHDEGFSKGIEYLNGITLGSTLGGMVIHHPDDVSGAQIVSRNVPGKDSIAVKFNGHFRVSVRGSRE